MWLKCSEVFTWNITVRGPPDLRTTSLPLIFCSVYALSMLGSIMSKSSSKYREDYGVIKVFRFSGFFDFLFSFVLSSSASAIISGKVPFYLPMAR